MSHVTHMNECICEMTHEYVTWLIYMWHDSCICGMTHAYVTWIMYMWQDSSRCQITHSYVTWLIHTRDTTNSYFWHGSFICVTWLIHTCDMTHSYAWPASHCCCGYEIYKYHDSSICDMTRPTDSYAYMRDMTHEYVTWLVHTLHDSFICDTTHSYPWPASHCCRCTGQFMCHDSSICDMGWLRLAGS